MCQTLALKRMFPPLIKTFIFDMDGVVNLGDSPIQGAAEAITELQRRGRSIYFLTNNSSRSRDHYVQKLDRFGIQIEARFVYTSAYATALYLISRSGPGKKVYVVGEYGLAEELANAGLIPIVDSATESYTQIDYVVAGIDRSFSYDKLLYAHAAVTRGHAELIATNRDATYPTENGEIPGGGSIVAAVATAVGREPITIGKPQPFALEMILRDAGVSLDEAVMVGDRLDTDIAAGNGVGIATVLVLTGVTSRQEAELATELQRPTKIIGTLAELLESDS
jgi:phosphoglycolate/pyridoxal phosphate phosphatase family enzyme